MYKFTIQFAVPATVTSGPEFVKWMKGVIDASSFQALAEHASAYADDPACVYTGRWKPSDGVVEAVRVFSNKKAAEVSLAETKELYVSNLAQPVFSKVTAATEDFITDMQAVSI